MNLSNNEKAYTQEEVNEHYERGFSAAMATLARNLVTGGNPLFFQDECDHVFKCQAFEAMGWNAVCASTGNQHLWKRYRKQKAEELKALVESGSLN